MILWPIFFAFFDVQKVPAPAGRIRTVVAGCRGYFMAATLTACRACFKEPT